MSAQPTMTAAAAPGLLVVVKCRAPRWPQFGWNVWYEAGHWDNDDGEWDCCGRGKTESEALADAARRGFR